jgi:hypothetical protein
MQNGIFKYLDSIGVVHTQSFAMLSVKGCDDPDRVELVPPIRYDMRDGYAETAFKGFRRVITMELNVLSAYEDYIRAFLQAQSKSVTWQGRNIVSEQVQVVWEGETYENEWIDNYEGSKKYILELRENTIRTVWPVPINPVENMIGYIKTKVKIAGTQTSPETFTTNSGKLQYNYGTTVYPPISLLSYVVSVIANGAPYQDGKINQVGDVTQSGNNITFQLAVSDAGNPSADTYFYADIAIILQEIT